MQIARTTTVADSTFKWESTCAVKLMFRLGCNPKRLYEFKILSGPKLWIVADGLYVKVLV
jgi:hypothetical protein